MLTQFNQVIRGERGSLAPLGIGLSMLSLLTVLFILASGSLYLTERRLTTVAEATALYVISESENLDRNLLGPAEEFLSIHPLLGLDQVSIQEALGPDGLTVRIRLCSIWQPLFVNYIFSETGRVCSEGLAPLGK